MSYRWQQSLRTVEHHLKGKWATMETIQMGLAIYFKEFLFFKIKKKSLNGTPWNQTSIYTHTYTHSHTHTHTHTLSHTHTHTTYLLSLSLVLEIITVSLPSIFSHRNKLGSILLHDVTWCFSTNREFRSDKNQPLEGTQVHSVSEEFPERLRTLIVFVME
jgi:hypothetical protein